MSENEFMWIVRTVASAYDVTPDQLLSRVRTQQIAEARQAAMRIVCDRIGNQLETARRFNRDHGSVHHARKTIARLEEVDKRARARWQRVRHLAVLQRYENNVIDYQI